MFDYICLQNYGSKACGEPYPFKDTTSHTCYANYHTKYIKENQLQCENIISDCFFNSFK